MSMKLEDAVRYEVRDEVAVLTIDFPPVNALGAPMREGMMLRLAQARDDAGVKAIVVIGANDRFVAGADIREFGKPKHGPELHKLQEVLEHSEKPVVCAIVTALLAADGDAAERAARAHVRRAARFLKSRRGAS